MSHLEPANNEEMERWIADALGARDRFAAVAEASERHRAEHDGCEVYPSTPGHLLGVLAAASGARRILEIGGGLGYSTLWLAHGAGPGAHVDTIERDPNHARQLRASTEESGYAAQVDVHMGDEREVVRSLPAGYDLVFYDAAIPGPELIEQLDRLLPAGGVALVSNLFLGRYMPDDGRLRKGAAFRAQMLEREDWLTSFVNGKLLAVRR